MVEQVLSARYALLTRMGMGGHGVVWRARDTLTGEEVAVKTFRSDIQLEPARVRREIAALRLMNIPGVVRMLDENVEDGVAFIVMELVEGVPFPGRGPPVEWSELEQVTHALLEVVGRVHAAGIIHRDLKPANVLVTASGRPIVLDFGLSLGTPLGDRITDRGHVLGTPIYMAPEEHLGATPDFRSDIYALGVMLYEALTAGMPHGNLEDSDYLVRKLTRPADPLLSRAPNVPEHVAQTVDAMLMREPARRLASPAEVLRRLRAEAGDVLRLLPRLGDAALICDLVASVESGSNVAVVGTCGSGLSRTLDDCVNELRSRSRSVVRLEPHLEPFGSLAPMVAEPSRLTSKLEDVVSHMIDEVRAILEAHIIVVDGLEEVDAWSRRVLLDCADRANLLVSARHPPERGAWRVHALSPLSRDDLTELFAGPSRVFHLPEDAAQALHRRTGGVPRAVRDEIDAWMRAGLVQPSSARFAILREGIDQLEAVGPLAVVPETNVPGQDDLVASQRELLEWLSLLRYPKDRSFLAQLTGRAVWRVEADVAALEERGFVREQAGWPVLAHAAIAHAGHWTPIEQRRAHAAIGALLGPGEPGRLHHLLRAENVDPQVLCAEAVQNARREARSGALARAITGLNDTLRVMYAEATDSQLRAEVLEEWLVLAVREGTPRALDRVIYEIERCQLSPRTRLDTLARAALSTLNAPGPTALAQLDAIEPFAQLMLELTRQDLRALAARRCSADIHRRTIQEAAAWAERIDDREVSAARMSWLGRLQYREGDYAAAAGLFLDAAKLASSPATTVDLKFLGAASLMETFAHEAAAELAREARDLAAELRQPAREAWAEWTLRAALYRAGHNLVLDDDWLPAVRQLGISELTALACFTEAAVAFRLGELECANDLCGEARRLWERLGKSWTAMLAGCLAVACIPEGAREDPTELTELAFGCPVPGLGLQALALLARGGWQLPAPRRSAARALAAAIPEKHWSARLDVLSVNESLRALVD